MDRFGRFIKCMDDSVRQVSTIGEENIKRRRGRKYNCSFPALLVTKLLVTVEIKCCVGMY